MLCGTPYTCWLWGHRCCDLLQGLNGLLRSERVDTLWFRLGVASVSTSLPKHRAVKGCLWQGSPWLRACGWVVGP